MRSLIHAFHISDSAFPPGEKMVVDAVFDGRFPEQAGRMAVELCRRTRIPNLIRVIETTLRDSLEERT